MTTARAKLTQTPTVVQVDGQLRSIFAPAIVHTIATESFLPTALECDDDTIGVWWRGEWYSPPFSMPIKTGIVHKGDLLAFQVKRLSGQENEPAHAYLRVCGLIVEEASGAD